MKSRLHFIFQIALSFCFMPRQTSYLTHSSSDSFAGASQGTDFLPSLFPLEGVDTLVITGEGVFLCDIHRCAQASLQRNDSTLVLL